MKNRRSGESNFAVTGLYLYDSRVCDLDATLKPSSRGEFEITDLKRGTLRKPLALGMHVCFNAAFNR
jgi:dTDP-glucose pyrophosphorylase